MAKKMKAARDGIAARWRVTALIAAVVLGLFVAGAAIAGAAPSDLVGAITGAASTTDTTATANTPSITADAADYNPGQTVNLSGANWDTGGTTVHIVVNDDVGQTWQHVTDVTPTADGTITDSFQLPTYFVAQYSVRATQETASGTLEATSSFTDANPSANLDQCANDPAPSPSSNGCTAPADWVNGNLGGSKAVYYEGDSVAYRMRFDNLSTTGTAAAHSVTIKWDTTKAGTHALDYLTSFDRTVATADPCAGVSGCSLTPDPVLAGNPNSLFAIAKDSQVDNGSGVPITQLAGDFKMYGAKITGLSAYSYPGGMGFTGDKSAQITIEFTAYVANPVLAWGGHIAQRRPASLGWGDGNAAVNISGSPYHMALVGLDGSGGSQDRSLSNDAVVFPGSITVVKDAVPNDPQDFAYSTTGGLTPSTFSLDDDSDSTLSNTQPYNGITTFSAYTFTETPVSGWALSFASPPCTVTDPNTQPGSSSASGSTVTVNIKEGENWTCTFTNTLQTGTLTVIKHVINNDGGTKTASDFTLHVKSGGTDVSGSPAAGSESGTSYTLAGGSYVVSENTPPTGYTQTGITGDCDANGNVTVVAGQTKTCTITNTDDTPQLKLVKDVQNDDGGLKVANDWTLSATAATPDDARNFSNAGGSGSFQNVFAGVQYTLAEDPNPGTGYSSSGEWTCDGGTLDAGKTKVTVPLGAQVTCTITNNDTPPKLHLRKVVVNDNGGLKTDQDFTLTAEGTGSNDLSGKTPVDSGTGLQADTWTLSETQLAGYSASDWVCVGGTQGTGDDKDQITVGIGGEATCTITNDDIAPKLHLRKVVVNDNGGTATDQDFTLTANGSGTNDISGKTPVDSGAGLKADTWALSETNLYGYTASSWSCDGGTQNGSNITVGIGGEATCTITNDDQPGTIVVIKKIKPVGALTSFTFQTTGTGYTGFSLSDGQQNSQTLNAGSYTVKELVPLGWVLTGIGGSTDPLTPYACVVTGSGGSTGLGDLDTETATVDLKNGDTVTCTFENTGQGATRTQGFWATHPQLANIAWFGGTAYGHTFPGVADKEGIGDTLICGRPVDTLGKLMGGFWSDISKKSVGGKRLAIDQARMQLLQQLLAAELNASAFGSVPIGGTAMFAQWEAALCGTNAKAISTAQGQAASFNSNGDSSAFTPGTSAQSKYARSIADIPFWDVIKP